MTRHYLDGQESRRKLYRDPVTGLQWVDRGQRPPRWIKIQDRQQFLVEGGESEAECRLNELIRRRSVARRQQVLASGEPESLSDLVWPSSGSVAKAAPTSDELLRTGSNERLQ